MLLEGTIGKFERIVPGHKQKLFNSLIFFIFLPMSLRNTDGFETAVSGM